MKNDRSDKSNAVGRNSFSNTKILYKPYNGLNSGGDAMDKSSSAASSATSSNAKSKTINSTVYKSVTPSITDRVIADLKKEEYLNQQRSKLTAIDGDGIEVGENDEAIYIDGDDEEDPNTPSTSITEIETSIEKLPDDAMQNELKPNAAAAAAADNAKQKKVSQTIVGVRDKKSSLKKPSLIVKSQKFKNFGFVDISDTDSSEAVDIDDDDYDDYFNSGSGDFNSQLAEQINEQDSVDWVAPTIEKIKAKKLNKQERILKSFADNSYGIGDNSQETDTDAFDFIDKDNDDDQMISRKFAKAHKKQTAAQQQQQQQQPAIPTKAENQKSKSKQNNRQKSNTNNKRKSKEQRYIDEYFSGTNTGNSAEGAEAELVKVCPITLSHSLSHTHFFSPHSVYLRAYAYVRCFDAFFCV